MILSKPNSTAVQDRPPASQGTSRSARVVGSTRGSIYLDAAMTSRPRAGAASRPRRTVTASQWAQENPSRLQRHRGKWVAISTSGIIANSEDFDTVFAQARLKGVDNPLVFKVPLTDKPRVVSAKR